MKGMIQISLGLIVAIVFAVLLLSLLLSWVFFETENWQEKWECIEWDNHGNSITRASLENIQFTFDFGLFNLSKLDNPENFTVSIIMNDTTAIINMYAVGFNETDYLDNCTKQEKVRVRI